MYLLGLGKQFAVTVMSLSIKIGDDKETSSEGLIPEVQELVGQP